MARQVGAPLGIAGAYQDGWEYTARSGEVVNAGMAALAAAGVLGMLRRRALTWPTVAAAWTGSGAMFGYALLTLLAVVTRAPESGNVTALNGVTQLGALLARLALALSALLHLVDRGKVSGTGLPAVPVTHGRPHP